MMDHPPLLVTWAGVRDIIPPRCCECDV